MADRSPIALLASAGRLLRANATAPRVEGSPGLLPQDDDCARDNCPCNEPLMQPALGVAVADWLEHAGEFLAGVEGTHGQVTDQALHNSRHALAVARTILGEPDAEALVDAQGAPHFGNCPDHDWRGPGRDTADEASADIRQHEAETHGKEADL